MNEPVDVTTLLRRWSAGDREALDRLLPLVYAELKRIASARLRRESPGHSLQSAALVNEVFLKLVDQRGIDWQDRAHFFAVASQSIRRILVDHARARGRDKRGGGAPTVSLDERVPAADRRSFEIVALDDALITLEKLDPKQSKVVELRFFAGLTEHETALVLGVSETTVKRYWVSARAWLLRELSGGD